MSPSKGLAGRIRAKFGKVCPSHAAERIESACAVFYRPIANMRSELREHRASLAAVKDALTKLSLTLGPLRKHYPSEGLPLPGHLHSGLKRFTEDALETVKQELNAITWGGRPTEPAPAGLARAIMTILADHGVPKVRHRAVVIFCFEWLDLGPKSEAAFKAARRKKVD
jgi:hypothetical protein